MLSASTYASIRRALDATSASYQNRNFEIFLQGHMATTQTFLLKVMLMLSSATMAHFFTI